MTDPNPEKTAVVIREALEVLRIGAVISKGWAKLSNDLKNDNVFVVDTLLHRKPFPKMRAIVFHGGAGTYWAVTSSGILHAVIPHATDQYYWANRLYTLGLNLKPLYQLNITGAKLASAINEATKNEHIRKNCLEMEKEIPAAKISKEQRFKKSIIDEWFLQHIDDKFAEVVQRCRKKTKMVRDGLHSGVLTCHSSLT